MINPYKIAITYRSRSGLGFGLASDKDESELGKTWCFRWNCIWWISCDEIHSAIKGTNVAGMSIEEVGLPMSKFQVDPT